MGKGLSCALAVVAIVAFASLIIFASVRFWFTFFKEIKDIKCRLHVADSTDKRSALKTELRCRYLCLLPLVNKKNVMKVYCFFCREKHIEKSEKSLFSLLMPSVACIVFCMTCLCGLTWAWFSAESTSNVQTVTAASYYTDINVLNDNNNINVGDNGSFLVEADKTYTITLSANGTATTGYCKVVISDSENNALNTFYTVPIANKSSIAFTYIPDKNATVTITSVWGSLSNELGVPTISDGSQIKADGQ